MTEPDLLDLIRAANWLAEEARLAQKFKRHTIHLPIRTAERLADILLAAVNRHAPTDPDPAPDATS